MLRTLIFAVTCSAAAAADLYSNCAQTERTGVLPLTADVKVTSSITGGDGTCFKVADAGGKTSRGGHLRCLASGCGRLLFYQAVRKPTAVPPPPPAPEAAPPAPARATRFANFYGTNLHDGATIRVGQDAVQSPADSLLGLRQR